MSDEPKDIRATIATAAAEAEEPEHDLTKEMGERLDKVQFLIEQMGKSTQYLEAVNDYVTALRAEVISLGRIRQFAMFVAK